MKFTKETLKRTLRTFLQAILGFVTANVGAYLAGIDYTDKETTKSVIIGFIGTAVATGICAVMNLEKTDDE